MYPVTQGATTIWERWDTQKPDGTIIEGMNSFNHYAYGAIGEWMYNHIAGLQIDPNNPGYKHILFNPHPGGGLSHATAEFESLYGKVKSAWTIEDNLFMYEVTIPANTTGTVTLNTTDIDKLKVNSKVLTSEMQSKLIISHDSIEITLGSGNYQFEFPVK